MPNAAPKYPSHIIARGRAEAFPSEHLAGKIFYARFSKTHRSPHPDERLAIQGELRIHFRNTIIEMSHSLGDRELPILRDGDMPTLDFATKMLHKLRIVGHDGENTILALMGSELMALMLYPSPKSMPVNGSYELAYDHKGDTLVLRPKTVDQEQAAA